MNDLTPIAGAAQPVPQFPFRRDDVVLLGDPANSGPRRFVFQARHVAVAGVSRLQFANVETQETVFLTDAELAVMMAKGHFDVLTISGDTRVLPRQVQSALLLTDAQKAMAARRKAYVLMFLDLPEDVDNKRRHVEEEAREIARTNGHGRPLSYNTIVKYAEIYRARHDIVGDACLASPRNPGRWQPGYADVAGGADAGLLAQATQHGVNFAISMPKGTGESALHSARNWLADHDRADLAPKLRSIRSFQRLMAEMNRYAFDALRVGSRTARRKWAAYYERKRPELPLEEVECDHTTMDVRVFDEDSAILWGRPDIITFRDRASGVVLGFSIGFEQPSYASFMQGLRHAMYPKDFSNGPSGLLHGWPYFGRPKRLGVDNAFHFVGNDIRHACEELGIEKVEFRPGNPWLKGAQERLFGILNGRIHNLPGATQSNVAQRKALAEVEEQPALTLRELECFLIKWFVDEYNVSDHEGLGPLRSLKGNPARIWREKQHQISLDFLPGPDLFLARAGDTDWRTITSKGIEWDYICYQSDKLNVIRTHHLHKPGSRNHPGTKYRVVRDPYDVGKITLRNPYDPDAPPIVAEAVRADYARGLTLHQHKVHIANWTAEQLRDAEDAVDLLMQVKDNAQRAIEAMRKQRQKADVAGLLARYVDGESRKARAALTRPEIVSEAASAAVIDPSEPERLTSREWRSRHAMDANRDARDAAGSGAPIRMDATDVGGLPKPLDPATTDRRASVHPPVETATKPASTAIKALRELHKGFDD